MSYILHVLPKLPVGPKQVDIKTKPLKEKYGQSRVSLQSRVSFTGTCIKSDHFFDFLKAEKER